MTTLATVGYGDLHPTAPLSKAFTIVYIVLGVGVFVAFITKVTAHEEQAETGRRVRFAGQWRADRVRFTPGAAALTIIAFAGNSEHTRHQE